MIDQLNLIGALGWLPEFSNQFSIVDFSDEFRSILIQVREHLVLFATKYYLYCKCFLTS